MKNLLCTIDSSISVTFLHCATIAWPTESLPEELVLAGLSIPASERASDVENKILLLQTWKLSLSLRQLSFFIFFVLLCFFFSFSFFFYFPPPAPHQSGFDCSNGTCARQVVYDSSGSLGSALEAKGDALLFILLIESKNWTKTSRKCT